MKKVILFIIGVFVLMLMLSYTASAIERLEAPLPLDQAQTIVDPNSPFKYNGCNVPNIEKANENYAVYIQCELKLLPGASFSKLFLLKEVNGDYEEINIAYKEILTDKMLLTVLFGITGNDFQLQNVFNYRLKYVLWGEAGVPESSYFSNTVSLCKERDMLVSCAEIEAPKEEESPPIEEEEEKKGGDEDIGPTSPVGPLVPTEGGLDAVPESEEEEVPTLPLSADKAGCSLNKNAVVGSFGTLVALFLIALTPLAFVKVRRRK